MRVDTKTWESLNAYHDGELDRREAASVRARLRKYPELRAALDEIAEIASALKPLHPATPVVTRQNPDVRWFAAGFIPAAAAAAAIIVGAVLYSAPNPVKSALDWHHTFASRSYPVTLSDSPTPVSQWIGNDLDLTPANLTLVDVVTIEGGDSYLHYSGVNGCRLTVGASSSPPVLPDASDTVMVQAWTVGPIYYSMVAEGMDRSKFTAISHLLEDQTEGKPQHGNSLLAVRDATSSALPCA